MGRGRPSYLADEVVEEVFQHFLAAAAGHGAGLEAQGVFFQFGKAGLCRFRFLAPIPLSKVL